MQNYDIYYAERLKKNHNFFSDNYIYFLRNTFEKKLYLKSGLVSKNQVIISGKNTYIDYKRNIKNENREEIKKKYKLKKNHKLFVLYDLQPNIFGYISSEEIFMVFETILNAILNKKYIALIVKPHPAALDSHIKFIKELNIDNLYMIPKNHLITPILSISDLVITKFSTIGVDAMLLKIPVISFQFSGSDEFKLFDKYANYVYSLSELKNLLEKIFLSIDEFKKWKDQQTKNFDEFIELFKSDVTDSAMIIASVLRKKLNEIETKV